MRSGKRVRTTTEPRSAKQREREEQRGKERRGAEQRRAEESRGEQRRKERRIKKDKPENPLNARAKKKAEEAPKERRDGP